MGINVLNKTREARIGLFNTQMYEPKRGNNEIMKE